MIKPSDTVLALLDGGEAIAALKSYVAARIQDLEQYALHKANNWEDIIRVRGERDALRSMLRLEESLTEYRKKISLAVPET